MADRVIYKGGQSVPVNVGGNIQLILPKRGSYHKFPRWWNKKPGAYIECAIFRVKLDNGAYVRLIIPSADRINLEIRHDGFGNFTFPAARIDRVAIFKDESPDLLVEYQFSKISGGKVLKRSVSSLPPYPAPPEPLTPLEKFPRRPSALKRRKKTTIKVEVKDQAEESTSDS